MLISILVCAVVTAVLIFIEMYIFFKTDAPETAKSLAKLLPIVGVFTLFAFFGFLPVLIGSGLLMLWWGFISMVTTIFCGGVGEAINAMANAE